MTDTRTSAHSRSAAEDRYRKRFSFARSPPRGRPSNLWLQLEHLPDWKKELEKLGVTVAHSNFTDDFGFRSYRVVAAKGIFDAERYGSVDARLRKWSQGLIEDQTFQQMTDEFADLIVPKVCEREGRKISRVATRLSMSPKKVRRILTRLGLRGE